MASATGLRALRRRPWPAADRKQTKRVGILREIIAREGHATDNARDALERLDGAFAAGELARTPFLEQAVGDLRQALAQDEGQRLGGKSAEASRFILRAIDPALDEA